MPKTLVLDGLLSVSHLLPFFLSCALLMYSLVLKIACSAYMQTQLLVSSMLLMLYLLIVESPLTGEVK